MYEVSKLVEKENLPFRIEYDEQFDPEVNAVYDVPIAVAARNEQEFLHLLSLIFSAEKTINVITAILSQTDPDWKKEGEIPF
jgi:hypothetical protein